MNADTESALCSSEKYLMVFAGVTSVSLLGAAADAYPPAGAERREGGTSRSSQQTKKVSPSRSPPDCSS